MADELEQLLAELETTPSLPQSVTPSAIPDTLSPAQVGAGLLYRALGAAIPFGREAVLSGAAGIEALRGADYETARAIREAEMKQAMEAAATALPGASTATELGVSLLQPGGIGKSLLRAMGIGGAEGLLYGAAEQEGTLPERLQKALPSAAIGAATAGVVPGTRAMAEGAKKLGKAGQMTAVGLTVKDIVKRPELADKFVKAREAGLFKGFSKKGENLADNLNSKINEFEGFLENTLKDADAVSTASYKPTFDSITAELEKKYTGVDLVAAKKHLKKQTEALSGRFDGTLSGLQAEKRKLYKATYKNVPNSSLKKQVDELIGNKIKTTIENGVDELAVTGKLDPSLVGSIKEANDTYGSILTFKKPIDAKVASDKMDDATKKILSGIRTSGGLGTAIVTGNLSFPATVLAYEALTNPSSRYLIGRGLEAGGAGLQSVLGTRLAEQLGRGGAQLSAREQAASGAIMTPIVPVDEQSQLDAELRLLLGE